VAAETQWYGSTFIELVSSSMQNKKKKKTGCRAKGEKQGKYDYERRTRYCDEKKNQISGLQRTNFIAKARKYMKKHKNTDANLRRETKKTLDFRKKK